MHVSDDILRRYDVPAPRYTSYPPVPHWTAALGPDRYACALERAGALRPAAPLSIYVHLPFCRRLCAYCGCNVVVARDTDVVDAYLDHVEREIDLALASLGGRRRVSQVHWGGGTPTFLRPDQMERLWAAIAERFRVLSDAEIAVEIDPRATTTEQLALLRQLGFNRLSLGVQDLDPVVQEAIGRGQTEAETRAVLEAARALGFSRISLDLVYGLPAQTPGRWERTLETLVGLGPDRLALYSFAHVPALRPQQKRLPLAALPDARTKLELFLRASERLRGAGYQPIGMDHFAREEDELSRAFRRGTLHRNFLGYTVRSARDLVAFGASAISDLDGVYAQNATRLPEYYAPLQADRLPTVRGLVATPDDRRRRRIIEELMCRLETDVGAGDSYAEELERLRLLERDGLVRLRGTHVQVTELGRLFLRNVAMAFDARMASASATPMARTV